MPTLKIHREHKLGLARARGVARDWSEHVERKFDMKYTVAQGRTSDTVEFTRSGVEGRLIVAADHFDLEARLGVLLGIFAGTIESEIEKELDRLLAECGEAGPGAAKAATRAAAAATGSVAGGGRTAAKPAGAGAAKSAAKSGGKR